MTPSMFLNESRLTPVFPPIPASTCDSNVVGTLTYLMPLLYIEAANPAISVVTPPPMAMRRDFLSARFAKSQRQISITVSMVLLASVASIERAHISIADSFISSFA